MLIDSDSWSRKWQITINNPVDKGYTHEWLKEILGSFKSLVYWCMADEIGEEGTYHTHLYMACKNAVRFSTIKSKFEGGHYEMARGTSQQNRDYIFKEGKHEKDKKRETHLSETREEYGQMPIERQGARNDLADLYDMIKQGLNNDEIIEVCPQYMFNIRKLDEVHQTIRESQYRSKFREIKVTYVFGQTGKGKTRDILETYGYENVYRVTEYNHPFDHYMGQDVLVFEEFRSSVKIGDMLNYLDGYPLMLPCRYNNKVACFTKVYIVTNIPLDSQYENVQKESKESWGAFLRRIDFVKEYKKGRIDEKPLTDAYWYHDHTEKKTLPV